MSLRWVGLSLFFLCGCREGPTGPVGLVWPLRDFFSAPKATFSGFPTSRIATFDGGIPWRTSEYETPAAVGDGSKQLVVQPAFQNGDVAAYVITEIWQAEPDPWVQPIYHVNEGSTRIAGVLGVGVDSTYYSPFWRLYNAEAAGQPGPYQQVSDIIDAHLALTEGPLVVCPIVPADLSGLAVPADGGLPMRPFSHELVQVPAIVPAYADGVPESYLDLGADRQVDDLYEGEGDGIVEADDFYVFAKQLPDGGRSIYNLPAILSDDAQHHAYVQRTDVVLAGEAVFVPFANTALRAEVEQFLGDAGVVPIADENIPTLLGQRYMLRVATDASCFGDFTVFPQGCTWLDSEDAIENLVPQSRIFETNVKLTATPVLFVGPSP